jgi:hypothetical protein
MIKATGRAGNAPLLILGLSRQNVEHLMAGRPIHIPATEIVTMGLPSMTVAVIYGETEQEIAEALSQA